MNYRLYKKEDFHIEKHGQMEETQLAIFPGHADFQDQDFIWRISLAEITQEESEFIKLPDYDRTLMVLEGEAVLMYGQERVVRLKKMEQDHFDGDLPAKCFGNMQSCNLTVRKGNAGFLEILEPEKQRQVLKVDFSGAYERVCQVFYCCEGYGIVTFADQACMVRQGELLVISCNASEQADTGIMGEGTLMRAQISYGEIDTGAGTEDRTENKREGQGANICQNSESIDCRKEDGNAKQKGTFEDFKECMKLSLTNFRGSRFLFPRLKQIWYDESLKAGIRKIERFYFPMVLWFLGIAVFGLWGSTIWEPLHVLCVLLIWTGLVLLVLSPLMYFLAVPKPVKAHIKRVSDMTEYERNVQKKEQEANPVADRILKKYTITGRNVYLEDDRPKRKRKQPRA